MSYDKTSSAHHLKIIAGQVNGLAKMIEEDKYCIDILVQSLAIQNALKKINKTILEGHLDSCVVKQMKGGEEKKAIKELVTIYSLSERN